MRKSITKFVSMLLVITMAFSTYVISPKAVMAETSSNLEHDFSWDMYEKCGRLENVKKGEQYTIAITKDKPIYVVEYTATKTEEVRFMCGKKATNFMGGAYLFEEDKGTIGKLSTIIDRTVKQNVRVHDIGYVDGVLADLHDDYPKITTVVEKGKKYYFVIRYYNNTYEVNDAEIYFSVDCPHKNTEVRNKTIESCEKGGYTGDTYCLDCGKKISDGKNVEPGTLHNEDAENIEYKYYESTCKSYAKYEEVCTYCDEIIESNEYTEDGYGEHSYVVEGYVAPTCTEGGSSGKSICKYCGDVEYENHILKPYHEQTDAEGFNVNYDYGWNMRHESCMVDGYTGDCICRFCGEIFEKGRNISANGHKFSDGECTECEISEGFLPTDEDGYYKISTSEDFIKFIDNTYREIKGKLVNDLDFSGVEWDEYNYGINSILDGNGHTIKNWNLSTNCYIWNKTNDCTVRNLTIEVDGETDDVSEFGVIVRNATNTTFESVTIKGNIKNNGSGNSLGALVGVANDCMFVECKNEADIISVAGNIGGIVGCAIGNTIIKNCVNSGNIGGTEIRVRKTGGIVGLSYVEVKKLQKVKISGCTNNGKIYFSEYSGGILGEGYNTAITNCINQGKISGGKYVGNIAGYNKSEDEDDMEIPDITPDDKPDTSEDETTSSKPKDDTPENDIKVDNNKNNTPTPANVSKPKKMKIKSAKNLKGRKIKITWKKVKNIQGYRVRYSTNKKFKKATVKTISKNKTSLTIKKLKKKTYYIQICAYKKTNGKTYAGSWSTKKTVKVRK